MSVTAEEIQRVREHECRMNGHSYSHLENWQVDGPVAVVCMNCGKKWNVEHEKPEPSLADLVADVKRMAE